MDYNVYYASRQPVISRSNSIAIPHSSVLQSPHNDRNSSTASHDSGYSSSMSNRASGGSPRQQARNAINWANSQDWDRYRAIITKLYREDGLHLKRVKEIMSEQFNFSASERMYKTRISKWALDKNLKAHDVMVIYRMNHARAMIGKRSIFTVRGRPMEYSRIEQYLRRDPSIIARINNDEDLAEIPADYARNAGITCSTPAPSPTASPSLRPASLSHGPTMAYGSYSGYTQPAQNHDQQQQQQFMHRQSFAQSAVLPSQATMGINMPQMQIPVTTSAMNGFGGIPATSGPSSYGNAMYSAPLSPTISPYNSLVTSAAPASSAYQLSHPSQYPMGSASQTTNLSPTNLTPSTPASTLSMLPNAGTTPRTIDADVRNYSFAAMPSYVEPGQAVQGHMINGHEQFNGGRVQQQQQQQHHHYPQPHQHQHQRHQHQQASPITRRSNGPNGQSNGQSSQSTPGANGNSSIADQYGWPMDPNAQWDSQFQ